MLMLGSKRVCCPIGSLDVAFVCLAPFSEACRCAWCVERAGAVQGGGLRPAGRRGGTAWRAWEHTHPITPISAAGVPRSGA